MAQRDFVSKYGDSPRLQETTKDKSVWWMMRAAMNRVKATRVIAMVMRDADAKEGEGNGNKSDKR